MLPKKTEKVIMLNTSSFKKNNKNSQKFIFNAVYTNWVEELLSSIKFIKYQSDN